MNASTTANATAAPPPGGEFSGDSFTSNLISDLGPLLTLFGEATTKQFLSVSTGWADNVLLAMGPLGLLTIVVSAIRVGGVRQLKALVGRARESRADAELELLTSTSPSVSEMWNGSEIVRVMGTAEFKHVCIKPAPKDSTTTSSNSGNGANPPPPHILNVDQAEYFGRIPPEVPGLQSFDKTPNLTLNLQSSAQTRFEVLLCAVAGSLLQLAALIVPAWIRYHWRFGDSLSSYGYPCFLVGTILTVVGVVLCSRVVESSTREFEANDSDVSEVLLFQKETVVNEERFKPTVILLGSAMNERKHLSEGETFSRLRTENDSVRSRSTLAAIATTMSISGFVIQFVGLRALHWSVSLIQLGLTVVMTAARSLVRRELGMDISNVVDSDALVGWESTWTALHVNSPAKLRSASRKLRDQCGYWEPKRKELMSGIEVPQLHTLTFSLTDNNLANDKEEPRRENNFVASFMDAAKLLHSHMRPNPELVQIVASLKRAIESVMKYVSEQDEIVWKEKQPDRIDWELNFTRTSSGPRPFTSPDNVQMSIHLNERGVLDAATHSKLFAVTALWTFSYYRRLTDHLELYPDDVDEFSLERISSWCLKPGNTEFYYLRVIGAIGHSKQSDKETLQRWLGPATHGFETQIVQIGSPDSMTSADQSDFPDPEGEIWPVPILGVIETTNREHETTSHPKIRETKTQQEFTHLAVSQADVSLVQQGAVDIFTTFMHALASKIQKVSGKTTTRLTKMTDLAVDGEVFLSNSVIDDLVSRLVESKLCGPWTPHETSDVRLAREIVIPTLAAYDLLPTEVMAESENHVDDESGFLISPEGD